MRKNKLQRVTRVGTIVVSLAIFQGCHEQVLDDANQRVNAAAADRDLAQAQKNAECAKTAPLQAKRDQLSKDVATLKTQLDQAERSLDQLASDKAKRLLATAQDLRSDVRSLSTGEKVSDQQIQQSQQEVDDLKRRVAQLQADIRELTK